MFGACVVSAFVVAPCVALAMRVGWVSISQDRHLRVWLPAAARVLHGCLFCVDPCGTVVCSQGPARKPKKGQVVALQPADPETHYEELQGTTERCCRAVRFPQCACASPVCCTTLPSVLEPAGQALQLNLLGVRDEELRVLHNRLWTHEQSGLGVGVGSCMFVVCTRDGAHRAWRAPVAGQVRGARDARASVPSQASGRGM